MVYLLKMVIFHGRSYVSHNQRVPIRKTLMHLVGSIRRISFRRLHLGKSSRAKISKGVQPGESLQKFLAKSSRFHGFHNSSFVDMSGYVFMCF